MVHSLYTHDVRRPAFSRASISACNTELPLCTRRLCPRPIIFPACTRTEPMGMPPSCRPLSASSIATFIGLSLLTTASLLDQCPFLGSDVVRALDGVHRSVRD